MGDLGLVPGMGRFPGGGHGNPLQYSCLEIPSWIEEAGRLQSVGFQRVGHDWVTKHSTAQNAIIYTLYAIFTYSYQPGSMLHMFTTLCHLIDLFDGFNSTYSSAGRRKWQSTPVFLSGESQGQRSLVGCHLWGHTESDTSEAT